MTLLIVGKSSTGKTSSLRNLDFSKTVYVNAEAKAPSFRGSKNLLKNIKLSNTQQLLNGMQQMEDYDEKLTIVVDSISMLMDLYFAEHIEGSSDTRGGWANYKSYFLKVINMAKRSQHDYVFTALAKDTYNDKELVTETFASVQGSLFKAVESHFTVVLHTVVIEEDGKLQHKFITNKNIANKGLSCKSPFEMFDTEYIDNDVVIAFDAMRKYYEDE